MKKLFKSFLLVSLSIFFLGMNVKAEVTTIDELSNEIDKVQQLATLDFSSFYNKSEMIGNTFTNFNFATSDFRLSNKRALDSLNKINEMLQKIEESDEYSDTEKERLQIELYQKANEQLNGSAQTPAILVDNVRSIMPSITFSRFRESFLDFCNNLGVNGSYIEY